MPGRRVEAVSRMLYRNTSSAQVTLPMVARQRNVNITTSTASFTPGHTAKTKQAWKYRGGQILRAPNTWINGTTYTDPKDPGQPRRKQESNFFITINSNKTVPDDEDRQTGVKHMEEMLKQLMTDRNLAMVLTFGPVDAHYARDKYTDVIDNVEWKGAVETGDKMNRLHCHVWVTIKHYSQIQVNTRMVQHLARDYYNRGLVIGHKLRIGALPYVHTKLLPQSDWTDIMKQYIHKGMG